MSIKPHTLLVDLSGFRLASKSKAVRHLSLCSDTELKEAIAYAAQAVFTDQPPDAFLKDSPKDQIQEIAQEAVRGERTQEYEKYFYTLIEKLDLIQRIADSQSEKNTELPIKAPGTAPKTADNQLNTGSIENPAEPPVKDKNQPETAPFFAPQVSKIYEEFVDIEGLEASYGNKLYSVSVESRDADVDIENSGDLIRLPQYLPPPPPADHPKITDWLEGRPWHPFAIGVSVEQNQSDDFDTMMELQSEFFSSAEMACKTYAARKPCQADTANTAADALDAACRDLGMFSVTFDAVPPILKGAILDHYKSFEPEAYEFLMRRGVTFSFDVQLVAIVGSVIDIETFYLKDGLPDGEGGVAFDPRSTISESNDLSQQNVLKRAIYLHFQASESLPEAFTIALNEFRHAQLNKLCGVFVSPAEFDPIFLNDKFTTLSEYMDILTIEVPVEVELEDQQPDWA